MTTVPVPSADSTVHQAAPAKWPIMLAALGVVYGDIGTSPLYAMKECFNPASAHHVAATPENVLGVLSLVFWSLLMVVSVKYLTFVLRADNQGEGEFWRCSLSFHGAMGRSDFWRRWSCSGPRF